MATYGRCKRNQQEDTRTGRGGKLKSLRALYPRGSVLGSMFIGGVLIEEKDEDKLAKLGLKDSKLLSDRKREKFVPQIKELAEATLVKELTAQQIDKLRQTISLNQVEIEVFLKLIEELKPDKVIIDLLGSNGDKFKLELKAKLGEEFEQLEVVAENKADVNYPLVSAASILAKSAREQNVRDIEDKYGIELKTGYPHDQLALQFMKDYLKEEGELPPEARASWSTCKRIVGEDEQAQFDSFY